MTDNITRFQSFTKVVGPAARAAALGLASFGVAAALVSHILPALVSGFVLLGGAITAVVGAISVGLVGGLLAAAPAFVALGTGLLASLPLFKQLNIEMEKNRSGTKILGDAITALTKQNEENGKSFSRTFAGVFAPLIRDTVLPLYDKMQQATTTLVTHFGTLFNSPQMQKFLDVGEVAAEGVPQPRSRCQQPARRARRVLHPDPAVRGTARRELQPPDVPVPAVG